MTLSTWLKFGHLIGLVLLSGGIATQLIAYAGLLRADTVGELRTWQKLPKERLSDGGMGLLILTGLAMAGQSWSFTDGWILAAIGVLAVTIAAAVAGVGPRNTRLKAALAAAGDGAAAAPAELTATARDPVLHGAMRLQLVALVEIVYLMVRKPSGVGILVSLLVAAVAVVAGCWPLVGGRQAAAGSSHLGRARRRRGRIIASTILLAVVGLLLGNAAMVDRQDADATGNSTLPPDGGNIYLSQNGPRDAPALVLIHGLGSSTRWGIECCRCWRGPITSSGSTCSGTAGPPNRPAAATRSPAGTPGRPGTGPARRQARHGGRPFHRRRGRHRPHRATRRPGDRALTATRWPSASALPCPVGKPGCRAVSRRARFMGLATRPGRSIL